MRCGAAGGTAMYGPTKHYEIPEYECLNFLMVRVCDVFTELVFELDFRK